MSDPKHKTPLLDELEEGKWPSFVTGLKKLGSDDTKPYAAMMIWTSSPLGPSPDSTQSSIASRILASASSRVPMPYPLIVERLLLRRLRSKPVGWCRVRRPGRGPRGQQFRVSSTPEPTIPPTRWPSLPRHSVRGW